MKRSQFRILLSFIPALFWMGFIYYFSSQSGAESSSQSTPIVHSLMSLFGLGENFTYLFIILVRKSAHIIEYSVLTFLLFFGFHSTQFNLKKKIILSGFSALIYACFDEFHQLFSINRSGEIKDVLIDSIGIILTSIIVFYSINKKTD